MRTTSAFGSASLSALHHDRRCDATWRPRRLLPEDGDHGAADAAAAKAAADKAAADKAAADAQTAADKAAADKTAAERGFPENTKVVDMTTEQQANYWKYQSRKHEDRVTALGVTPEQLEELRTKAKRADDLDYELASDKDKAVADAKREAEEETRKTLIPELVTAKFETAVGDRLTAEQLAKVLEPLDLTKFLDSTGKVDAAKVKAHAEIVAPAKGGNGQRGPSASGQGQRTSGGKAAGMAAGRDMFAESRKGKTTTTTP